jgi:ABC-type multidrug transport system ATPase subunit
VFVSTHLIAEFEGLIDEFTIIEDGRAVLSADADRAREHYQKVYARFAAPLRGTLDLGAARVLKQNGREIEVLAEGDAERVVERLKTRSPEVVKTESLTLEEIFVAALQPARGSAALA